MPHHASNRTQHDLDQQTETTICKCGLSAGVFVAPVLAFGFTLVFVVLMKFHRPHGVTPDDVWTMTVLLLLADTLLFVLRFVAYDTSEIRLTDRKLYANLGCWNKVEISIDAIETVELYESMLGDGTIIVVPNAGSPLVLSHVPSHELLYNSILDQQDEVRAKQSSSSHTKHMPCAAVEDGGGFAA